MPIGTINTAKEQAQAPRPLLLATVTFLDGTILRLSTDGLRTADAGFSYAGNDYLPRILNQDIAAIQALSDGGIDIAPSVTLELNNADGAMWQHEIDRGWRGARLVLTFIFWTPGQNDFSSDSITKFRGICGAPEVDETRLRVTATSLLALANAQLPTARIQPRCLHHFPRTAAERQHGADNEDSLFYGCGYSPDATGANARGNYSSGTTAFTSCNRTKEHCVARGMYTQDSSSRTTGRFSGVQWDPPKSWRSRAYKPQATWEEGSNTSNEAKYGDVIPLVWGTAWVEPKIANVIGDANSTRFECLVCWGEVDQILRVVVNDVELPAATDMSHGALPVADALFRWNLVNRGDRDGAPNADAGYDSAGDPYGSICVLECVVPRRLAESSAVPRVRVLLRGPKLRKYTDVSTYTKAGYPDNENLAWIIMDQLIWSGLSYSDLDIQSFIDAAAICAASVTFKDHDGLNNTHGRFTGSVVLDQRQPASEILRGARNACRALLVANSDADAKLKLVIEQTLAAQQAAPVAGSNYSTAIASKLADGTAANGYVAYDFSESNILRRGGQSTFRLFAPSALPNRVGHQFQDRHNNYSLDSETIIDVDGLIRDGGVEKPGSFPLVGVASHDHARRVISTWMARQLLGNPRNAGFGDAGGTWMCEFETTFRAVRLQIGQIVRLSYAQHGISNQLMRIERVQPTTNYEYCKLTLRWHSDEWYLDTFGQEDSPRFSGSRRNRLARPPYPIFGNTATGGLTNPDPMYGRERFFGLTATRDDADLYQLRASSKLPVNTFPAGFRAPWIPHQGNTASTGGALPGNTRYYVELVAIGPGGLSAPSIQCQIDVPAGTSTNTITVPDVDWDASATGYGLFVGTDPQRTIYQGAYVGTPASVTFTGPIDWSAASRVKPDPEFDFARWRIKRVRNAGVAAFEPTGATSSTITLANAYWTTNQWAGYDVSAIGADLGYDAGPLWNWRIVSNTSDTLTVDTSYGPAPNAVLDWTEGTERYLLVIRTKPTTITADTITEPNWDNSLALDPGAQPITAATNASPIVCTVAGHGFVNGDKIRVDFAEGNTAANGLWTVAGATTDTFELSGSVGNGAYTGGGIVRRRTGGLGADEAKGKLLRILAGKGRGHVYKIASNTATAITIEGQWIETPDSSTRFITEEPDWLRIVDTSPANIDSWDPPQIPEFVLDLAGHGQRTLLVQLVPVDGGGNEAMESACQLRDTYCFHDLGQALEQYQSAVNLTVDGTLSIGSDQASRISLRRAASAVAVKAVVKTAPSGADLTVQLLVGTTEWMALTIPSGSTAIEATASQLASASQIPADTNIRLDLVTVGTTFPGADLSVAIYL